MRECLKFWEQICPGSWILEVIRNGYCIPFLDGVNIPSVFFPNSKLAQSHFDFVDAELKALLAAGAVRVVASRPRVTSPLSVAANGLKLRLILDLSWLNQYVTENRFSLPSIDCVLPFLPQGGSVGSFDFKSGYHDVDVREDYQTYLGFSWVLHGRLTHGVHGYSFRSSLGSALLPQAVPPASAAMGIAGHSLFSLLGRRSSHFAVGGGMCRMFAYRARRSQGCGCG
jgi:hypothetical protein